MPKPLVTYGMLLGKEVGASRKKIGEGTYNLNILDQDAEGVDDKDCTMTEVQVDRLKVNTHVLEDEKYNAEPFIDVPNATIKSHRVSDESLIT